MSSAPLVRLLAYLAPQRPALLAATVHSVLNKVFDLAPPLLIGLAVDTVVERDASFLASIGVVSVLSQLIVLAVLTFLIWGLESVFEYLLNRTWRNLAQTTQHELRLDAYRHVQSLGMGWFAERRTGNLLSILNDDVNQLERFLDVGANDLIQVTTTCITVGAVFFWVSPTVALLAVLPVPVILWGSFQFQRRIAPRYADVRERASRVSGQLSMNLSGIETIKAFVAEDREVQRVRDLSDAYRQANRGAISLSSAFSPLIRMAILVGFTATLVWGGWLVLDDQLAVGSYSVLIFLTQRLLWPLTRLGQTFDLYQRAMASTKRILDLLDEPVTLDDGAVELPRGSVAGHLRFEGVGFRYPGAERLVLDGVDVDIPAGFTVAVVGPTGAGKSTLLRLVLRLHDPTAGRVTLDGRDIRELKIGDLRRCMGLVSQNVFLFDGTVADNLRYGREDATDDEVVAAARAAEAHDFVMQLPDGYDTLVGERGQKLSGGQQQRLSIARALLADPPILVLDEATSAVDNETEAAIQRSLERAAKGRTTLVIAHRLSTIRHADHIVVLDQGRVVEEGRHDELLERDGAYARLWAVQTGARATTAEELAR